MATTITNRASVSYRYGAVTETVSSNLASTVLSDPLTVSKSALETAYRAGEAITYVITVTNGSTVPLSDVTISDNLGACESAQGVSIAPLSYVGPAKLYLDGVYQSELSPVTTEEGVAFTIPAIPQATNATILYKATPSAYAPMTPDSAITNVASFSPAAGTEPITAQHTLPVDSYAALTVEKEMSPNPISDGGVLVNTFTITNTGNVEATELVLSDVFMTPLSGVSVSIDGSPVAADDFEFADSTLTLPADGASLSLTVPAATFAEDPDTGAVTMTPGVTVVTVTGTV